MTAAPRLFFLPGAGADPGFWQPVGERLPADWEKTYFGWPGLGRQPPAPEVNSLEDLVVLVEARLDDRPVDLIAQSMGGLIAMLVTLRHPEKVRRLVLSVTSAGVHMPSFGAADWRSAYHRNHPGATPWVREVYADLSADLPRVTQPVLLLWGDADAISPVAVGEHLGALLPHSRLYVARTADHDLVHDRADEVAPLIREHLE